MKGKDIIKVHYKGTTKQKSKLRQGKAFTPDFKNSKVVAEKETLMKEYNPQYRFSEREAIRMENVSGMEKIQKEWMLITKDSKTNSYWKVSNK